MLRLAVVAMVLGGSAALAAEPTEGEQRAACTGDVFRHCFAEIPSRARISECMIANRTKLSSQCRAMIDLTLAARRSMRN